MRSRVSVFLSVLALFALLGTAPLAAQDGSVPRTPWGDPALSGAWTNATMTPMQRPADLADREFLTEEEVAARQGEVAERSSLDNRPRTQTGAYNEFWMERGNLNRRTSLVIDPPNGRLPALTGPEQYRQTLRTDSYIAARFDSWLDFNKLDRCITRGLPGAMMPGFYNHNYQIVQSEDYVVILVEMIHDARHHPAGWAWTSGPCAAAVAGRVARPLGRRYARHRDHQLQRQDHGARRHDVRRQ